MVRQRVARLSAFSALVIAAAALVVVLATAGSTYVVHADFADAGQLVPGDLVTVGGHEVGSVGSITLTANGLADVKLEISNHGITPLRQGTIATVGQLSLTGVANRFVALTPGVGQAIPSGGTLPAAQTRGIVDLDTLLDSFTPRVRASLQGFLKAGAYLVARPTASQLNSANALMNPAFSQSAALGREVVADDAALAQLVSASARVSTALAAPSANLGRAVSSTAAVLRELAGQRSALEDSLLRAPTVLRAATGVLGRVSGTLSVLDPTLVALQPVAGRLARLLTAVLPAARNAVPTIASVRALLPSAESALSALPAVERQATPAVQSLTRSLLLVTPILAGLRPYAPDVVAGFFNGVGGATAGSYDANGHYLHGEIMLQGGGSSLTGLLNLFSKSGSALGPFDGERTGLLSPCPGGGNPPAADNSNPWTSPDVLPATGGTCTPGHDQK
jgi:phospholipid/cholesterol/gamma-HCH transport system substrate-binding protein